MAARASPSLWTGLWGLIEGVSFDLTTAEEFLEGLDAWEDTASDEAEAEGEEQEKVVGVVVETAPEGGLDYLGGEIEEIRGGVWDVLDMGGVAEEEESVYFDALEDLPSAEDMEAGEWLEMLVERGGGKARDERFGGWLDGLLAGEFLAGGLGVEVLGEVTVHERGVGGGGEVVRVLGEEKLVGKSLEEEKEEEELLIDVDDTPRQDEQTKTEDEQVSTPVVDTTLKEQQQETPKAENNDTTPTPGPSQQSNPTLSKRQKKKARKAKAKTAPAPAPTPTPPDTQAQNKGKQKQPASPSPPQPSPKKTNYPQAIDK